MWKTKAKPLLNKIANTKIEFSKTESGAIDLEIHVPEDKKEMCTIAKTNNHDFKDAVDAVAYAVKALYDLKEDNKNG